MSANNTSGVDAQSRVPPREEEQTTTTCRQCLSKIPLGARVCVNCGSAQDWRAQISLSSTVLALVVALVSVLSATLPEISKVIFPFSDIHVSLLGMGVSEWAQPDRPPELQVLATNHGQRPGVITALAELHHGAAELPMHTTPVIVPPQESRLLVFTPEPGTFAVSLTSEPTICELEIQERAFNGASTVHKVNLKETSWLWSTCLNYENSFLKYQKSHQAK